MEKMHAGYINLLFSIATGNLDQFLSENGNQSQSYQNERHYICNKDKTN